MVKIIAPNMSYTGVSAGIAFAAGVGYTDDPERIAWFERAGYTIGEDQPAAETVEKAKYDELLADHEELTASLRNAIAEIERLSKLPGQPDEPPAATPEPDKPDKPPKAK